MFDKNQMRNRAFLFVMLLALLTISIGVVLYFSRFNSGYSKSSGDWSNFATFIGFFVNLASLFLLGYISFVTFRATTRFNDLQLRPHIYLTEDKVQDQRFGAGLTWVMVNRSNVPASNVIVRFTFMDKITWTKWIICFSLGRELKQELNWVFWPGIIQVCYANIENTRFFMYEIEDWIGTETEITREGYLQNLRQARQSFYANGQSLINTNNIKETILIILQIPDMNLGLQRVENFFRQEILKV